jgi:hypothetical protein
MGKIFQYKKKLFTIFFPLIFPVISHALPFNIVPNGSLPTTVPNGGTVSASYIIQNNTIAQRNNNFVKYLPPNVTVASGGTCTSPTFNLAGKGQSGDSCTLNLTVSGAVNAKDPNPQHHLFVCLPGGTACAGTNYPLNVSVIPQNTVARAYITDPFGGNVYVCNINNDGVFSAPCVIATSIFAPFLSPEGITLNTDGTKAYIAEGELFAPGISTCDIDQSTGLFSACSRTSLSFPNIPFGVSLNSDNSIGYIATPSGANILYCPPNDFSSGACQSTGYGSLVTPVGGPSPLQNIFTNNNSLTYVIDSNEATMFACNVNPNGSFSSCSTTGSNLNFPNGIAANPAGTFLFLTNSPDEVTSCDISQLPTCSGTTTGFDNPFGVAVNETGNLVYVVNSNSLNVSVCSIQNDGTLTNCQIAGATDSASSMRYIAITPNLS